MSNPNSPFGDFHLQTEIPYFSGEYVDWWIYHIECFFYQRRTIPEMKIRVAEVYLVGEALQWYREWDWKARWSWQRITWETFVVDLKNHFKPPEVVKSEVLKSILVDLEKVKQLIVEMRAQNLAYMASLSELKHYSSPIPLVKLTESKAAEEEQFDSKQIITDEPGTVTIDVKDNEFIAETPDKAVIINSVSGKGAASANNFCVNYKVPCNSLLAYISHNMEFTEIVDDSLRRTLYFGRNENDMSFLCHQTVCENDSVSAHPLYAVTKVFISRLCSFETIMDGKMSMNRLPKPPDKCWSDDAPAFILEMKNALVTNNVHVYDVGLVAELVVSSNFELLSDKVIESLVYGAVKKVKHVLISSEDFSSSMLSSKGSLLDDEKLNSKLEFLISASCDNVCILDDQNNPYEVLDLFLPSAKALNEIMSSMVRLDYHILAPLFVYGVKWHYLECHYTLLSSIQWNEFHYLSVFKSCANIFMELGSFVGQRRYFLTWIVANVDVVTREEVNLVTSATTNRPSHYHIGVIKFCTIVYSFCQFLPVDLELHERAHCNLKSVCGGLRMSMHPEGYILDTVIYNFGKMASIALKQNPNISTHDNVMEAKVVLKIERNKGTFVLLQGDLYMFHRLTVLATRLAKVKSPITLKDLMLKMEQRMSIVWVRSRNFKGLLMAHKVRDKLKIFFEKKTDECTLYNIAILVIIWACKLGEFNDMMGPRVNSILIQHVFCVGYTGELSGWESEIARLSDILKTSKSLDNAKGRVAVKINMCHVVFYSTLTLLQMTISLSTFLLESYSIASEDKEHALVGWNKLIKSTEGVNSHDTLHDTLLGCKDIFTDIMRPGLEIFVQIFDINGVDYIHLHEKIGRKKVLYHIIWPSSHSQATKSESVL